MANDINTYGQGENSSPEFRKDKAREIFQNLISLPEIFSDRLNRTKKKLGIGIITSLLVSSCSSPLEKGVVVNKQHDPSHTNTMLMPITIPVGKSGVTTFVPYTIYDGEDFILSIEGKNEKGEIIRENVYVDANTYNCITLGDSFQIGEGCSREDTNNSKERQ